MSNVTATTLSWESGDGLLHLRGVLDRETLLPLWQQRDSIMQHTACIDVAALERVDSAGLALLVHLQQSVRQRGESLRFTGITDKLDSLITLYNLQDIIRAAH